jgi:hypothetical protein
MVTWSPITMDSAVFPMFVPDSCIFERRTHACLAVSEVIKFYSEVADPYPMGFSLLSEGKIAY